MTTIPTIKKIEGSTLYSVDDHFHLAATMWGEARGEGRIGMQAVGNVVVNRSVNKRKSIKAVVKAPWQFSCWNQSDPNSKLLNRTSLAKLTGADKKLWEEAQSLATLILTHQAEDLTGGSDHYHAKTVKPNWTKTTNRKGETLLVKVATIGKHTFYKPR